MNVKQGIEIGQMYSHYSFVVIMFSLCANKKAREGLLAGFSQKVTSEVLLHVIEALKLQ